MPELMRFICDLVTKRDILALLRVCRQLYCNVAPLIWETIDDISVLIKLIPDVETLSDGTYIRFTRLPLPSTLDMTRFKSYARYVRTIMVPPNAECEKDSLDVLHASTRSSPFLPNLEKIRYKSHWISGRGFVKWVTMALSPSVRTFQSWQCRLISISGWIDAWMSLELAVVLLRNISSGCPNLELLEIFPSNITGGSDIAPLSTVIVDFSDCLSSFANLRTLSSNAIVLEPCIFLALSKLPHLESLTLYPNQSDGVANGLALSEDAFPTLRELELNMLNLECLTYLFGLKLLVRQLKSLRIALRPNLASHGGKSSLSLTKQICAFAEHNSVLSSLSIEGEYPSYMVEIDSALVKCFSHFPLHLLALPVHTFSLGVNLHDLFEALPTIEQLYITPNGFRVMKLEDLRMFASCKQLPYLRLLGVSVDFESVFDVPEMGSGACQVQSLLPIQFQSCFEQVGEYEGLGKPVARYLRMLWPNVTCSLNPQIANSEDDIKGMEIINDALLSAREGLPLHAT